MSELTSSRFIPTHDSEIEPSVRPRYMHQYLGQEQVKQNLLVIVQAAKQRGDAIDHTLIYGPPGLGKTTLAQVIANELQVNIRITSGPAIERAGDLASILTNIEDGDILFIDEIHRLNKLVEETLYPAMEDNALDIVIGKGPSAQTVRLDLPKFSVIGATTRIGLMSAPIRDRFGAVFRLNFYEATELAQIVNQSARILGVNIMHEATEAIALRSRGTPRIANRLLRRMRDFAEVQGDGTITVDLVNDSCHQLGIDAVGLDGLDKTYLMVMYHSFNGGPVGIDTIAAALSEDSGTLEDVVEPFLIQKGFIKKTPKGREITPLGITHIEHIEKATRL